MRVLFLSPFPSRPLYGGAVVRNHYLAASLSQRHDVWASFVGLDGGTQWVGEVPLRKKTLLSLFFLRDAWRILRKRRIETIVASSLIAGLHGAILKRLTGLPFWMDEHNVEWHCCRRYGYRAWPLIYLLEGFVLRNADWVTCVSPDDRVRLIHSFRLQPERVRVASNGAELASLRRKDPTPTQLDDGKRKVLFFGVLGYPPNREAVAALAENIAPLAPAGMEFVVAGVGGEGLQQRYPQLTVVGFVEDIHTLIRECDAVIVPLKTGGGTRLKILEAIACGRRVLSTECGAEGLDREALGTALTVTDSLPDTLDWLARLPKLGEASVGPRFEATYDWKKIWNEAAPF